MSIATTAFGYMLGKRNDFFQAFGQPTASIGTALASGAILALVGAFNLQRRLYGPSALSRSTFVVLSLSAGASIVLGASWGPAVFSRIIRSLAG